MDKPTRIAVAQLGARRSYAVPRILEQAGLLHMLYTDTCVKRPLKIAVTLPASCQPNMVRRLLRRCPGVAPDKVTAFTMLGARYGARLRAARTSQAVAEAHLWAGREFCRRVLRRGIDGASSIYGYNTGALELLKHGRTVGMSTCVEQTIAPMGIEREILAEEHETFPHWQQPPPPTLDALLEREKEEWSHADIILCGSEFVREGIRQCGGPYERCKVIPYGVDVTSPPPRPPRNHQPLRILTVGTLGLRKGTPYVAAAAKDLKGGSLFRLVGSWQGHNPPPVAPAEWAGDVPHRDIAQHYLWADVFLLPSLCEGSAVAVYEALAYGLPVITTPNAGSVVRDGVDGFIVQPRDVPAIVERVTRFMNNRELVREMATNAVQRAADFTTVTYGRRLVSALVNS